MRDRRKSATAPSAAKSKTEINATHKIIDNFMGDETTELTLMEKASMDSKCVTNLITIKGWDHAFRGGLNRDDNEKA